jgi:hypothetical protein
MGLLCGRLLQLSDRKSEKVRPDEQSQQCLPPDEFCKGKRKEPADEPEESCPSIDSDGGWFSLCLHDVPSRDSRWSLSDEIQGYSFPVKSPSLRYRHGLMRNELALVSKIGSISSNRSTEVV